MQYRQLGQHGLKISALSFGSWLTFGNQLGVKEAQACIRHAYEQGVNFFDNAEAYARGESEIIMGEALKGLRREDLVISTKIFWGGQGVNDMGLSRKHLIEGTKNSLQRLQLDYVDLLFCHRPDPNTPIEETVRAMDYLVRSGFAFYWGTSEWSAEQIIAAHTLAEKWGCIPPAMEQPQYNLFHRSRVEQEYAPLYSQFGMGTTIWSPLASGLLSGKYNHSMPPNARLTQQPQWRSADMERQIAKVKALTPVTQQLGCTLAQLAIAWCLTRPFVSSVIIGATQVAQLQENLQALKVVPLLTDELIRQIESITT